MVTGGGTGGHVYPALAVAEALRRADATAEVLFVGHGDGLEARVVRRAGLAFAAVPSGPVVGRHPLEVAASLARVARGVVAAGHLLDEYRPDAVLATGGYVCVPAALAARLRGLPVVVVLPDVVPGLAVRALARLATVVAASYPDALPHLPRGRTVLTGYPLRASLWRLDRVAARASFALDDALPTLLVLGGSRGARSVNQAVAAALEDLLARSQVVHVAGERDEAWLRARAAALPATLGARYHLFGYLDDLPRAMMAADLAVARAGAATCAEFPAAGLPSVLVPYPHAGAHQARNARYLVRHGAAVAVADAALPGGGLLAAVSALLDDAARRVAMAERARRLAVLHGADAIVALLLGVAARHELGAPEPSGLRSAGRQESAEAARAGATPVPPARVERVAAVVPPAAVPQSEVPGAVPPAGGSGVSPENSSSLAPARQERGTVGVRADVTAVVGGVAGQPVSDASGESDRVRAPGLAGRRRRTMPAEEAEGG
ncbi:MAG: undecaprenyldiphospho-muramoylpentapeptide beta-N-acetylglucosaminyltransferase [Chloroflexi bacterium]|nr:undecaprenyldiphospho-muramoylpentapeptide beta-N-acetylglucosaminyltransferase [Chloroflexota bacterium]